MCIAGVMAALYLGLDFLAVSISAPFLGALKISFSGLPVIITAIVCGPWWGAASGLIGAFAGQMITYGMSATTVLWILPAFARGLSVGYLFILFKRSLKTGTLVLETCLSSLLVTLLNTGAMLIEQVLYGYYSSYFAIFIAIPSRIVAGILTAICFALLLPKLVKTIKNHIRI